MIFVTGCARSGTSLITRLLQVHGAHLGAENRVNVLFENVSIRENILKPYLMYCGADPLGQDVLPDTDNLPKPLFDLRKQVNEYLPRIPSAYKDAKLTLVWPIFHKAFPAAKWVIVRRDKQKIVESCMRTGFMRKRKVAAQWEHWVEEHEARFVKMKDVVKFIEVWTDDIIQNNASFVEVAKFCGLSFNLGAVQRTIDRKRWHPIENAISRSA